MPDDPEEDMVELCGIEVLQAPSDSVRNTAHAVNVPANKVFLFVFGMIVLADKEDDRLSACTKCA
jgi:hypothetical protein